MKTQRFGVFRAVTAALGFGACATTGIPRDLADARTLRDEAFHGPAAVFERPLVNTAEQSLRAAEEAAQKNPSSNEALDTAYIAKRRMEIAVARGNIHEVLEAFRDGAGPDVTLRMDLNFSQRTEGFIRIAKEVEKFNLTWLECDIHDPDALALLRRSTSTPIASLETIHGLQAFKPYLANYACDVAIVDVQWNGMWESVRIASLADAFETDCAPHNFAGHMSSLISAHFCAAIPNYRIMEYDVDEVPWRNDLFTHPPVIENGQLVLSNRPGWGSDVVEEAVKAHPVKKKK